MISITENKHPALVKIDHFLKLEKGWHFGEGVPATKQTAIKAAVLVEEAVIGRFDTDVFPGIDGEIMVTVYHKEHYLEFIVEKDGSVTYVYQVNDEDIVDGEKLSFKSALNVIHDFSRRIWNTLGSFTAITTTQGKGNLKVWHLKIPHQAESQSLRKNVSKPLESTSANTCVNSTQKSPQNRLFFGSSPRKYYPKAVA